MCELVQLINYNAVGRLKFLYIVTNEIKLARWKLWLGLYNFIMWLMRTRQYHAELYNAKHQFFVD